MRARNGNVFFWEFPTGKAYTYQRSVTWSKKKKQELVLLDNWPLFLLEQPYYLDKAIKVMVVNNLEWLRGSSVSDSVMFCRKLKSFVSIYAMGPREVQQVLSVRGCPRKQLTVFQFVMICSDETNRELRVPENTYMSIKFYIHLQHLSKLLRK